MEPTKHNKAIESEHQQTSSRALMVVMVAISLLMPLIWYVSLYREPLATLNAISSSTLQTQEQGIRDRQAALTTLQNLDSQYRALDQSVIKTIVNAVPQTRELPELIVNLSRLIQGSGGSFEDFLISEASPSSKETSASKTIVYRVHLTLGHLSYEAIKQLMRTIYQNGRVLNITSAEYLPADSSLSLTLEAYSLP